jgi:hypothetical protein
MRNHGKSEKPKSNGKRLSINVNQDDLEDQNISPEDLIVENLFNGNNTTSKIRNNNINHLGS